MTYAPSDRPFYDADSHIMELPDFLRDYAASLVTDEEVEVIVANGNRHVEGGRDPIGRFEGSLGDRPDDVRDQFYAENFLRIFPDARVH